MIGLVISSIRQVFEPSFRLILLKALFLSSTVFVCLGAIVWFILSDTIFFNFWLFEMIADLFGVLAFTVITWLLFPAIVSFFISLFLEEIVDTVEKHHYPTSLQKKPTKLSTTLLVSLRFTIVAVFLNILAIPFYVLTFWFPPLSILIFYCLNGYLLGREYFELVAIRHLDSANIVSTRRSCRLQLFLVGLVITFLFTIPIINFFTPIFSVVVATHFFKTLHSVESI